MAGHAASGHQPAAAAVDEELLSRQPPAQTHFRRLRKLLIGRLSLDGQAAGENAIRSRPLCFQQGASKYFEAPKTCVEIKNVKNLMRLYNFVVLVVGGVFFGLTLGFVLVLLNSALWSPFFQFFGIRPYNTGRPLTNVLGVLSLLLPILAGVAYGFKVWLTRMRENR